MKDLELSKMTLKEIGSLALVSRNICHLQYQWFRRYELGRTDTTATLSSQEVFSASIKRQQAKGHNDKQTEMYKIATHIQTF
jgi:hypothetical protein